MTKTTIINFSCGIASAVCVFLLKGRPNIKAVYFDTGGEHPDNIRFLNDVKEHTGVNIERIQNTKYQDHFDVWKKERFINSARGAKCSTELKRIPARQFHIPNATHVYGFTADKRDRNRADSLTSSMPELKLEYPLIDVGMTKQDCINFVVGVGIEIPIMYILGFNNNNCIGCCKGGKGYWNMIRIHFPDHFKKAAEIEREIGRSCVQGTFLDELQIDEGYTPKGYRIDPINCGITCDE